MTKRRKRILQNALQLYLCLSHLVKQMSAVVCGQATLAEEILPVSSFQTDGLKMISKDDSVKAVKQVNKMSIKNLLYSFFLFCH